MRELWPDRKPILGVVHLRPLPEAPGYTEPMTAILEAARTDAEALVAGGVDGLILENFGDAPFFPGRVPASTVAWMTAAALDLRRRHPVPLGVNVLRNDGVAALAVAAAANADFIRVNVLCGARLTDQGIIQGIAHDLLRERRRTGAETLRILADVDVKHSAPLAPYPLEDETRDALHRGRADGVIVSGAATGSAVAGDDLERVRRAAGRAPVFIGSGARAKEAKRLLEIADGLIVGTAFKKNGVVTEPVDPDRVRAFMAAAR